MKPGSARVALGLALWLLGAGQGGGAGAAAAKTGGPGAAGKATGKAAGKARSKGKKPPHDPISAAIDKRDEAVKACALTHAIEEGATDVEIVAELTINADGQVFHCGVTVSSEIGGDEVRGCVQRVLGAVRFPRTKHPMTQTSRRWRYKMQ